MSDQSKGAIVCACFLIWGLGCGFLGAFVTKQEDLRQVRVIRDSLNRCPTAMDVYQGKTTLRYTIIDETKVDSVVIFKEEKIKNKK